MASSYFTMNEQPENEGLIGSITGSRFATAAEGVRGGFQSGWGKAASFYEDVTIPTSTWMYFLDVTIPTSTGF